MTTMLDKCAVAGDITQGIDRRGVWTAAITVIGGTSGTAVKLVSSDTVNGEYTDYKTLISAADAETDQYKGFVVDLHGAKKYIKVIGAVMATAVFGDCDHDVKAIAITEGEVPSGAELEDNKAVEITENGEIEITPSSGYDGMKKVTATVNVSGGGGTSFNIASKISGFQNNSKFIFVYDTDGNPITTIEDVKTKPLGAVCVVSYDTSIVVAISALEQYFSGVQSNDPAYDSESDSLYFGDDVDSKIDNCGDVSNWTLSEELITKLIMDKYS